MKQMSEFVTKLEGYSDLEVSIIRATKINKVLKAILKLSTIPKEDEFQFKPRSQSLLDKWNKLLASDTDTPSTSIVDGAANSATGDAKAEPTATANGTTDEVKAEEKAEDKSEETPATVEPAAEPMDETSVEPSAEELHKV